MKGPYSHEAHFHEDKAQPINDEITNLQEGEFMARTSMNRKSSFHPNIPLVHSLNHEIVEFFPSLLSLSIVLMGGCPNGYS